MMHSMFNNFVRERRRINENAQQLLLELDPGSDYGGSLGDVFLTPVKDAGKVISTDLKRLTASGRNVVLKAVNSVMSYLTAGYIDERLDEIDAQTVQYIEEILNDPDYRQAWQIIEPHVKTSIGKLSFMSDPVRYLTIELVKRSPGVAWSLTSLFLRDFKPQLPKIGKQIDRSLKYSNAHFEKLLSAIATSKASAVKEGRILTEVTQKDVVTVLSRPEIQTLLKKSPFVLRMRDEAVDISEKVRDSFLKFASEISKVNSVDALTKQMKVPQTELTKLGAEEQATFISLLKQKMLERLASSIASNLDALNLPAESVYYKTLKPLSDQISQMI